MKISTKDWLNYIKKMSKLSDIAGNKMQEYVQKNGFADREALIDYAHALVTKYGEGSAELACQMYDLIAEMENTSVPSAYPAATATYQETAKAINGSLKQSPGGNLIDSVAQRLVKQASADTMLKNAKRDGAYFAWIPHGDTCPYCLMMGGIGWQKAGKSTLNGNHANHIHAHCDCQFVVDFKGDLQVSDYDPDKLQNELLDASGYDDYSDFLADNAKKSTKGNRTGLNAVRRMRYEENKDVINAQKRAAYVAQKEAVEKQRILDHKFLYGKDATEVDFDYIKTQEFRNKFRGLTESAEVDDKICKYARKTLKERTGTKKETLTLLDFDSGNLIGRVENTKENDRITYNKTIEALIDEAHQKNQRIIAIHNHPQGFPPTADDCESAGKRGYNVGITVGHNGIVEQYLPSNKGWSEQRCEAFHNNINLQIQYSESNDEAINIWHEMMKEAGFEIKEAK